MNEQIVEAHAAGIDRDGVELTYRMRAQLWRRGEQWLPPVHALSLPSLKEGTVVAVRFFKADEGLDFWTDSQFLSELNVRGLADTVDADFSHHPEFEKLRKKAWKDGRGE